MYRIFILSSFAFLLSSLNLYAQMWNGQDTLYGNEWISYDQTYFKILVAEDGMHRLSKSALEAAGVPVSSVNANRFQLFHMGEEIPVFTSTDLLLGAGDYIEFYGMQNRGALDRYVYTDPDNEMLNPEYSLVSDSSAYFLTWADAGSSVNRYIAINNDLSNLPPVEPFYTEKALLNFFTTHIKEQNSVGVAKSSFDRGEGYGTGFLNSHDISISTSAINSAGGSASLLVRLSTNTGGHDISVSFNGNTIHNEQLSGFQLKQYNFNISSNELTNSNDLQIQSNASEQDRTSVSNVWLMYPRSFDFNGQSQYIFDIEAGAVDKYLEIENFNAGGQSPVLYDITNRQRIITEVQNGIIRARIPASNQLRTLVLSSQADGYKNAIPKPVNFVDYRNSETQFIILSHPKLYNDGSGNNFVSEYADYRSSIQGGDFNTEIIDIQQLYDQFGYGISRHFIAIRNFSHYARRFWDDPQYLFLIGKGREFSFVRSAAQIADAAENYAIPTFGSPGADNLFMSSNDSEMMVMPIGRLAVSSTSDIKNYLDKVQLMESNQGGQTIEDQLWKKQLMHLGGGTNTTNEPIAIKNNLFLMENIVENNKLGANVTSFFKTSSDPIQIGDSDAIFDRINNGLSIITFFGHSAVGTFDFNIENPARYENYGKYPLLLSLGCYSGNIHTSSRGISERFVFLKDKGVIAFGASTGQGYISGLGTFAKQYYDLLSEEMLGESIGNVLVETIKSLENNQSLPLVTLKQQFTLHGDPAIILHRMEGPDYTVSSKSVSFEPSVLTANLDSIGIRFDISNLGYSTNDSIMVEIRQELPNGDRRLLIKEKVKTPKFESEFFFKVASFQKEASGQNRLHIRLDPDNEIEEFPNPAGEGNNDLLSSSGQMGISFYIFDDSARPVYPKQFSIVNDQDVRLKASTSDGLAPERKYIFEIDTSMLFNSPLKERMEIMSMGGVISWDPVLQMTDSIVYYWRVSPDSISPSASYVWETSSFIYLPQETSKGWSQSHYYQYQTNQSESMGIDEDRKFIFPEKTNAFRLINKVYDPVNAPKGIMDNTEWSDFYRWELLESVTIVVFSAQGDNNIFGNTYGNLWFNHNPGEYGSVNATATRIASFPFPTDTQEDRENIINFLENVVPDEAYVVLYTALRTPDYTLSIDEWAADSIALGGVNLFNLLESYGASQVREMETSGAVPYTLAFQKTGAVLFEQRAFDSDGIIDYELSVPSFLSEGTFTTSQIGPASSWGRLVWDYDNQEVSDTASITVFGINMEEGNRDSLYTVYEPGNYDLSWIDISQYINIELRLFAKDEENQTPVDINRWSVLFEGIPEVAVSSAQQYTFYNDTLQQGEQGLFEIAIENVSDYDTDSLLLKYSLIDAFNNEKVLFERVAPALKDDFIVSKFNFDTKELDGTNNIFLEVNPDFDQPELYHFNNFAVKPFFIQKDERNPILDVTFDGIHILDGDIVSPRPDIFISLNDENEFLSLSDTSLFKLFLKRPGQQVPDNIPIETSWVEFYPDNSGGRNKASIRMQPVFEEDGIYELLVQAEDVTGNQSGDLDYKVKFEIITKSSISNVLNYPNPFSTSTQFVYTLTGEDIPEFFKIQIMTVSGRIVKEITQDEIGPLRVGTHRTEYRWDGTDEFGDRLANGVYLYRVVAKKEGGQSYEAFDNGTSSMFKKGFGKLVILR